MRGNVAHFRENGDVKVRVALPGLEDAKEEIEAVHFGLDHAIVVLLLGRPAAGVDGFETFTKADEPLGLLRHGGGAVIGPAINDRGMDQVLAQFHVLADEYLEYALRGEMHGFSNVSDTLSELCQGVNRILEKSDGQA